MAGSAGAQLAYRAQPVTIHSGPSTAYSRSFNNARYPPGATSRATGNTATVDRFDASVAPV